MITKRKGRHPWFFWVGFQGRPNGKSKRSSCSMFTTITFSTSIKLVTRPSPFLTYICTMLKKLSQSGAAQAECQSLRVNNCRQLIAEVGVEAVRRDNICKTQCSFAFSSPAASDPSLAPSASLAAAGGVDSVLTAPLPPSPPQPPTGLRSAGNPRNILPRAPSAPLPPRLPPRNSFSSAAASQSAATPFFSSPTASRSISGGLQVVSGGGGVGNAGSSNQGAGQLPLAATTANGGGQVSLGGGGNINQIPGGSSGVVGAAAPASRQPRPLFKMPSLRLPNLSDFFGL